MQLLKNKDLWVTKAYVDGQWLETKKTYGVNNPFDNSIIAEVSDLGIEEVEHCINTAKQAFAEWSGKTARERSRLLRKWFDLMMDNKEDLGLILTLEQGKPLAEAIGEIEYGASFIEWFSEEANRNYGDHIPSHDTSKRIITIKQAVGVCAAITPWNFPNSMITRKAGAALAAGCCMIVKPAKSTPLSALAIAKLAEEAGIPKGVFNVITTSNSREIGDLLCSHPDIKKISFTGSTSVGKELMKKSAGTLKRLSLELGGNAPFIVLDDANINKAVEGAIQSKFRNAGQTCVCSNRLFVHESIHDEFVSKLNNAVAKLKHGSGLDQGVNIGPMIDQKAIAFNTSLLEDAVEKGGRIESGGKADGNFFQATVVSGIKREMKIFSEEIFGPIAPVLSFSSEEELIELSNDTPYGLAAYFYGSDNARIWRIAEALEYGMVGINTGLISTTVAPFGGVKESGFGREGSKYGMDEYLQIKYLCFGDIQ